MAPESTKSKRKSAEKKVQSTEEGRPSKKAKTATTSIVSEKVKKAADARKNRKRAADFIEGAQENVAAEEEAVPKKAKKLKTTTPARKLEEKPAAISKSKPSKLVKNKKQEQEKEEVAVPEPASTEEQAFDGFSSDEEENIADQSAALLAGFESSSEDSDGEVEGMPLDQVPQAKISKNSKKALVAAQKDGDDTPGTLYIGRLPHGFYTHQMRAYFSQFGTITRLRMARNRKTGASKHFAFLEFASADVADIVAKTMNNYLMFGHILKIRRIPDEQVHPQLWKNANRRFKVVPRARLEARRLEQPKGREYWRRKVEEEEEKRKRKMEVLQELGYDFVMPGVKKVEDVRMEDDAAAAAEGDANEEETPKKAIEEKPAAAATEQDPVAEEVEKVIQKQKQKQKQKTKVSKKAPAKGAEKVKVKKAKKV